METVLVIGANTRSMACSLKKLGYTVYSTEYFGTLDLKPCVNRYKSILSQKPGKSCGKFTEKYRSEDIEKLATGFVDEVDLIICLAGVSPDNFPKDKIVGNKSVKDIDDKYQLYKKLRNKFNFPLTFKVSDIGETEEIISSFPDKNFIIKPRNGSGGYGIRKLDEVNHDIDFSNCILQEEIDGLNISTSVLSTGKESKTILTSQQIIGDVTLGQKEPYGYCGNITPFTDYDDYTQLKDLSENIISDLSLVGSNGVDFIVNQDGLHVVEVNPRIQGTMECAELSLNINLAEAHIKACQGHLLEVPPPSSFAVKMVVHAREPSLVGNLNLPGVHDLPNHGVIIEKGEPMVTVINSGQIREDTIYQARRLVQRVYSTMKPVI